MKKTINLLAFLAFILSTGANAAFITIGTSTGGIYDVDTSTGAATLIANGTTMTDIARDASGALWGVTFGNLYSIDTSTNTFTNVGSLGINNMNALTFNGSTLYGAGYGSGNLYTINTSSGSATSLGTGSYASAGDLAFDAGGSLYLAANTSPNDTLVELDPTNGSSTLIGGMGIDNSYGLAFVDSVMYGVSSAGGLYIVNTNTGATTSIGPITGISGAIYGATVSAIPVPATVWLFASGLLGLIGFSRKRS